MGGEPDRLLHPLDLLGDVDALAGVRISRRHDDGIRARILGLEPRGHLRPGLAGELCPVELHLPVGGQSERHQLGRCEKVCDRPRLWLQAHDLELDRERGRVLDRGVDPSRVRPQTAPDGV